MVTSPFTKRVLSSMSYLSCSVFRLVRVSCTLGQSDSRNRRIVLSLFLYCMDLIHQNYMALQTHLHGKWKKNKPNQREKRRGREREKSVMFCVHKIHWMYRNKRNVWKANRKTNTETAHVVHWRRVKRTNETITSIRTVSKTERNQSKASQTDTEEKYKITRRKNRRRRKKTQQQHYIKYKTFKMLQSYSMALPILEKK